MQEGCFPGKMIPKLSIEGLVEVTKAKTVGMKRGPYG